MNLLHLSVYILTLFFQLNKSLIIFLTLPIFLVSGFFNLNYDQKYEKSKYS